MAKWSRKVIGSVIKGKDGKANYVKFSQDVNLKKDTYVNVENEAFQLKNLADGVEAGRVNNDLAKSIEESINKTPWYKKDRDGNEQGFVIAQLVHIEKT